jgi:hypothetical protein
MHLPAPPPEAHSARIDRLLRRSHALFWLAAAIVFTLLIRLAPLGYDTVQAAMGGALLAGEGVFCSFVVGFPGAIRRSERQVALRALLVLALWFGLFTADSYRAFGAPALAPSRLFPTLVLMAVLLAAWVAIGFVARSAIAVHEEALRAERAVADARGERLARLRSQLAPHFIGNALNAIAARIDEAPEAAQRMTADLADLVRNALRDLGDEGTLREELERLEPYLALERARFEDRLELELQVEPEALDAELPPLLLQPLVENAIRHGVPAAGSPLSVRVELARRPGGLVATVSNPGRLGPAPLDGSAGVGVENVRRRLHELYPGRHELTIVERDGQVHARLALWSEAA